MKIFTLITTVGLILALFGFTVAYWAIAKYEPLIAHYIFTTIGLIAALYGFWCAYRSIKRKKPVLVGNKTIATIMVYVGSFPTFYGFALAFRGIYIYANPQYKLLLFITVGIGLAASIFGQFRALYAIDKAKPIPK